MTFNLLIACMYEKDTSILERSNVQSDVVVVNQCNHNSVEEFDFVNKFGRTCHAKYINTTERGLSRSRNMAIRNAWGDVCLICDDDELLHDDYEEIILSAYRENADAGIITFALNRLDNPTSYPVAKKSLGLKGALRTSSQQITFSRCLLRDNEISFDEKMGSGTGNGGGEENRFLLDCRKAGFKMFYYPDIIATIKKGESQWFKGFTDKFFMDRGWAMRRCLGFFAGYAFLWYNAIHHRHNFKKDGLSFFQVLKYLHKGFFEDR